MSVGKWEAQASVNMLWVEMQLRFDGEEQTFHGILGQREITIKRRLIV